MFPPTPPSAADAHTYDGTYVYDDHYLTIDRSFEFRSRPDTYTAINRQQDRLFKDPKVLHHLSYFKWHRDAKPPTYYSDLTPIGLHILLRGRPAVTGDFLENPDFLFGNCRFLEQWLLNGTGNKLFLLRDLDWFNTRPQQEGSTILYDFKRSSNKPLSIEVQELAKVMVPNENCVEPMDIKDVISRMTDHDTRVAPINLLSLHCKDDNVVPWPLAKHCTLLNEAASSSSSASQATYYASAGKESTEILSRFIDLQSCMHFQIFGQTGAISSWHMDSLGPYTWITLEPNYIGEPAEHVLKLWAYIRTDHLPPIEVAAIRKAFIRDGGAFEPDPSLIRVISLVAGDTLIMPPGTIHAPITITDCLFRGGMVMQRCEMKRHMQAWRFCFDNGQCTNENQPKQTRAVLDYFATLVESDPISCGYAADEIREFKADAKKIGGESMVCTCKSACVKGKCGCARNTQRCGSRCHNGASKCVNPYGCEAEIS